MFGAQSACHAQSCRYHRCGPQSGKLCGLTLLHLQVAGNSKFGTTCSKPGASFLPGGGGRGGGWLPPPIRALGNVICLHHSNTPPRAELPQSGPLASAEHKGAAGEFHPQLMRETAPRIRCTARLPAVSGSWSGSWSLWETMARQVLCCLRSPLSDLVQIPAFKTLRNGLHVCKSE